MWQHLGQEDLARGFFFCAVVDGEWAVTLAVKCHGLERTYTECSLVLLRAKQWAERLVEKMNKCI